MGQSQTSAYYKALFFDQQQQQITVVTKNYLNRAEELCFK